MDVEAFWALIEGMSDGDDWDELQGLQARVLSLRRREQREFLAHFDAAAAALSTRAHLLAVGEDPDDPDLDDYPYLTAYVISQGRSAWREVVEDPGSLEFHTDSGLGDLRVVIDEIRGRCDPENPSGVTLVDVREAAPDDELPDVIIAVEFEGPRPTAARLQVLTRLRVGIRRDQAWRSWFAPVGSGQVYLVLRFLAGADPGAELSPDPGAGRLAVRRRRSGPDLQWVIRDDLIRPGSANQEGARAVADVTRAMQAVRRHFGLGPMPGMPDLLAVAGRGSRPVLNSGGSTGP